MAEQVSSNELLETHPILGAIAEREPVRAVAKVRDAHVVVTDRRLAVASDARLMLDVAIDNVRRIQFDIERLRPATLVVVPENPIDEPQVLAVRPEEYRRVAEVLVLLGEQLAHGGPGARRRLTRCRSSATTGSVASRRRPNRVVVRRVARAAGAAAATSSSGIARPPSTTTCASSSEACWSRGPCHVDRASTRRGSAWPSMSRTTRWSTSTSRASSQGRSTARGRHRLGLGPLDAGQEHRRSRGGGPRGELKFRLAGRSCAASSCWFARAGANRGPRSSGC